MGLCDRTLGRCVCFDGFAGAACDRSELLQPMRREVVS